MGNGRYGGIQRAYNKNRICSELVFTHVICHIYSTFLLQVRKPPTHCIRIDGFLFPVQIQCPLPVIEHLVVIVRRYFDGIALFEKAALGHMQAHHVLLAFG